MSNTHKKSILQGLHGLALMLGVAFCTTGGLGYTQANVSSQGAIIPNLSLHATPLFQETVTMSAHPGIQLIIGILLLALGFLFHAWLTIGKHDEGGNAEERVIPVHAATKKPRIRRIPEPQWFWMEMDFEKL